MSSVYESSEVSLTENFSLSGVKDKLKKAAQKTSSAVVSTAQKTSSAVASTAQKTSSAVVSTAKKTSSVVVSGAKKVGKVAKAGFSFLTGWVKYVIGFMILMGLVGVYMKFFA